MWVNWGSQLLFNHPVMSNSLWPPGLQHAGFPCPSPSPTLCSNSCLLSQWCHPTISSSVVPFSSCLQSFPASGSFLVTQFFASGGQSVGASASALPMNIQGDFRIDWLLWSPQIHRNSQRLHNLSQVTLLLSTNSELRSSFVWCQNPSS